MPDQAPDHQAREFATAFRGFLEWIHSSAAGAGDENEVSALVRDFLGPDGTHHSVVTRDLPPFEHVNLQTAIDTWSTRAGRAVEVRGIAIPRHYGGVSLQQLVGGDGLPPLRLTAPALADLPNGPGSTLGCLRLAVLLVTDKHSRYVVMIQAPGTRPGCDRRRTPGTNPGTAACTTVRTAVRRRWCRDHLLGLQETLGIQGVLVALLVGLRPRTAR